MKLANPIIHQIQPTPMSCTSTCVAMAVGIPVEQLGLNLDKAWGFDNYGVWLAERGIWLRRCVFNDFRGEPFRCGALYLVGVRSLNVVASDHAVLVDTRGPRKQGEGFTDRSGWITYDPNEGREGKKVYDWVDEYVALDYCELVERDARWVYPDTVITTEGES